LIEFEQQLAEVEERLRKMRRNLRISAFFMGLTWLFLIFTLVVLLTH
jgi:hypothetical protein